VPRCLILVSVRLRRIARYTKRAVMAEYRTPPRRGDGKIVRFSYKDYAEGGKISYITMKVYTFIGRLIRHIPDKHFPMIRYAGLFTNRWKKQYLSQCSRGAQEVLIQIQKLCNFDHYSNIPVFQHSI